MIKFLIRLPLNRYVITASAIGVIGSTICIVTLKYKQYSILNRPYCSMAIDEIKRNQNLNQLIGEPIRLQPPDLVDREKNFLGISSVNFWLPFQGAKRTGLLHIEADRLSDETTPKNDVSNNNDDNEWKLKRLEMKLNDMPDKLLIIFKEKPQNE